MYKQLNTTTMNMYSHTRSIYRYHNVQCQQQQTKPCWDYSPLLLLLSSVLQVLGGSIRTVVVATLGDTLTTQTTHTTRLTICSEWGQHLLEFRGQSKVWIADKWVSHIYPPLMQEAGPHAHHLMRTFNTGIPAETGRLTDTEGET